MMLIKHLIVITLLYLTVETQCGVIDNLFGKVKNTTSALQQDVRNVWTYSKNIVGIETPADNRPEEEKRGLIGGIVHSASEKIHNFRNYFWNTDAGADDAGVFGNMYNRVKNKLAKVKGTLLGEEGQPRPLNENEKLVQKTLDKLFFKNGTRQVQGHAFQRAVENLRRMLQDIKKNATEEKTPVHHGEGLIDVRLATVSAENNVIDNTPGVDNDIYDVVHENLNKAKDETVKSYDNMRNSADKAVNLLFTGINSASDQMKVVRDIASDAIAKENELLQNGYSRVNADAKKVRDNIIKNTLDDAKRLTN